MRLVILATTLGLSLGLAGLIATPALADSDRYGHGRGHDRGHDWSRDRDDDRDDDRGARWHGHPGHHKGWDKHWDRGWDKSWDRRGPPARHFSHRDGRHYWGPAGRSWSHWNNSWGDPRHYARQWGFDEYHASRGWRRGPTWYHVPSAWSGWGGWNWSFSVSGGDRGFPNDYSYNRPYQACQTYRTEDWVHGRRALVTYVGCRDAYGRVFERPGTRRVEHWIW